MSSMGRSFKLWHFISYDCNYCSCDMTGNEKDCEYCRKLRECLGECEFIDKEFEELKQENKKLRKCLELIKKQGGTDVVVEGKMQSIIDITLKELEK